MATRFESTDVAVIGAGVSGLAAARLLYRAGVKVVVLEADKRVGGRLLTRELPDGTCFDLGGQWISPLPEMPRTNALVAEYGLTVFAQIDSSRMDLSANPLEAQSRLTQAEWAWFCAKLEALSESVDVTNPAKTPDAGSLDAVSVEEWKRANLDSELLWALFDQMVRTEYTIEPKDMSMLYFLYGLRTAGGIEQMLSANSGAGDNRVVEGLAALPQRMATELGERVLLGRQVYDVIYRDDGVRLFGEDLMVEAERVIVAVPPNQVLRIDFDPVLPRRRTWVMQRLEMGSVIKCFALYETPFWRGRAVNSVDPEELVFDHALDASSADDRWPALVAFIGGEDAVVWSDQSPEARRAEVLEGLARVFGPEALEPVEYFDHDWLTEPFIGGGYSCYAPPGVVTAGFEHIAEPIGPIHWAGTEVASTWGGYVEGAIEAGERAAAEVLEALRG
jgi:monoamine oxidase